MPRRDQARHYLKEGVPRYCAPCCGFHCTLEKYNKAVADADVLAEQLGNGWTARVWENFGWCWAVEKGESSIHFNRDHYTIFFNTTHQVVETGSTPDETVVKAVERARREASEMLEAAHRLEGSAA